MSVLKARLGLEQMKTPRIISEDGIDDIVDDDLSSIGDNNTGNNNHNLSNSHSRSVSVSTENLFATIESMGSFENDIKDAIQKVDDLMNQVSE